MISTDYGELIDATAKRGYFVVGLSALAKVLQESTVYKFRRKEQGTWQYEVIMPGYGVVPDMKKWEYVEIVGKRLNIA